MRKRILILIGISTLWSCKHKESSFKKIAVPINKKENVEIKRVGKLDIIEKANPLNKKIIGIWTSEGSINANFKIDEKTFYYVDDFADYKYSLEGNIITIHYLDYVYKGKVSFKGDTLILSTEEREVKYWRFNE